MEKISLHEVKEIARRNDLKPCVIRGTEIVKIRKNKSSGTRDITWEEFQRLLERKSLAIFRSKDDWLKIMKNV